MNNVLDAIIFYEDLSPEQKRALHSAMDANPELADSFQKWRVLQARVQQNIAQHVPDRNAMVLYALAQSEPALLTPEEQQRLERARPDLEAAFKQHPALTNVIADIQSASSDFSMLWDDLTTATREAPALETFSPDRAPARNKSRRSLVYQIAATVALLAIFTTAGILNWRSNNLEIVKTRAGEFRVVELVDGSTVRLFGKSRISYTRHAEAFAQNREIELKGRAFFDIAPDNQPFVVETATALTHATGTRFSIEANRAQTRVILTAGQVAVASKRQQEKQVLLNPGEMTQIPRRKQPTPPAPIEDLTDMLSWTGLLVFHDTPLHEVATHLNEYYNVSVSIAPELLDERWVATYDPDTLAVTDILENLAATFGVSVQATGENTYALGFTEN